MIGVRAIFPLEGGSTDETTLYSVARSKFYLFSKAFARKRSTHLMVDITYVRLMYLGRKLMTSTYIFVVSPSHAAAPRR